MTTSLERSGSPIGVGLALGVAVAAAATVRLSTFDVWWHLAYGREMVATGRIPRSDVFSFTAAGADRVDHEWLFQLAVYVLEKIGGPAAIIAAKALLLAGAAVVLFRHLWRETGIDAGVVAVGLLPFLFAGLNRFIVRPELLTLFGGVVLLSALFRRRDHDPGWRDLGWVPLLFAVWANGHGGFVVGLAFLGLCLAGRIAERLGAFLRGRAVTAPSDGRPGIGLLVGLLVVSTAACTLNPFGIRVFGVSFHITWLQESGIFHNAEWVPPQWPAHWLFWVVVSGSGLLVVARARRPDWPAILVVAFLASISVRYVRNLALFGFLAPIPLLTMWLPRRRWPVLPSWGARVPSLRPSLVPLGLLLLAASFVVANPRFEPGFGVDDRRLPVAAVDFLARERPPGELLNAHPFGGYVIWRLFPQTRVFIDGRDDIFAGLRERLGRATTDSREWFALLDEYRIGHTLLAYIDRMEEVRTMDPQGGPPRISYRPYAVNHFPPEEWALVYWDDVAMVHVRRVPAAEGIIAEHAYEHLFPESPTFQLEAIELGWATREGALAELARKLDSDPGSVRARRLFEVLAAPGAGPDRGTGGTPDANARSVPERSPR